MILGLPVLRVGDRYYLSPHFGRAPYFAIVEVSGSKLRVREVVENRYSGHEHGRGAGVVDLLLSHGVNAVIASGIGHGAFTRLRERGVKVYLTPEVGERLVPIEEAISLLMDGRLVEAEEPRERHRHP
jgi:predicted Fe-Mo cluster-binding NifX family protein